MKGTNERANGTRPSDCCSSEREGERQWEGKIGFISKLFPLMPDRRRRRARQRTEQSKEKLHSSSSLSPPPSLLLPSFIFPHEVTSPIHPSPERGDTKYRNQREHCLG